MEFKLEQYDGQGIQELENRRQESAVRKQESGSDSVLTFVF